MKLVHEKFDADFIMRRVREEQTRNGGRRVTQVKLNPREWAQFLRDSGAYRSDRYCPSFRFCMPQTFSIQMETDAPDFDLHIVEVVRE